MSARQLDIDGVNITVTGGQKSAPSTKAKSKAKAEGVEILSGAKLRLKEGQRYALVGRNGTGKSSKLHQQRSARPKHSLTCLACLALLKAIAEKLIPGIPEASRIAILQQTKLTEGEEDSKPGSGSQATTTSTLQEVIERATSRNAVEQEIKGSHLIYLHYSSTLLLTYYKFCLKALALPRHSLQSALCVDSNTNACKRGCFFLTRMPD